MCPAQRHTCMSVLVPHETIFFFSNIFTRNVINWQYFWMGWQAKRAILCSNVFLCLNWHFYLRTFLCESEWNTTLRKSTFSQKAISKQWYSVQRLHSVINTHWSAMLHSLPELCYWNASELDLSVFPQSQISNIREQTFLIPMDSMFRLNSGQ